MTAVKCMKKSKVKESKEKKKKKIFAHCAVEKT